MTTGRSGWPARFTTRSTEAVGYNLAKMAALGCPEPRFLDGQNREKENCQQRRDLAIQSRKDIARAERNGQNRLLNIFAIHPTMGELRCGVSHERQAQQRPGKNMFVKVAIRH